MIGILVFETCFHRGTSNERGAKEISQAKKVPGDPIAL
jgi:hypothetical protein